MTIDQLLVKGGEMSPAPQVACKLNRLLRSSSSNEDIVRVIQFDPALTARLLQVCNSPVYRRRMGVSSLDEAIDRLGHEAIRRTVWQVSMGKQMGGVLHGYGLQAGSLWRHSMTAAIAAEELWKLSSFEEEMAIAFTAGLLHDLGKILVNEAVIPVADQFRHYTEISKFPAYRAEKELFGFDHAEVGGRLLTQWGQSEPLVSSIANHHNIEKAKNKRFTALVYLSNHCAHHYEASLMHQTVDEPNRHVQTILKDLRLNDGDIEKVMEAMQKRVGEIEASVAIL